MWRSASAQIEAPLKFVSRQLAVGCLIHSTSGICQSMMIFIRCLHEIVAYPVGMSVSRGLQRESHLKSWPRLTKPLKVGIQGLPEPGLWGIRSKAQHSMTCCRPARDATGGEHLLQAHE